MGTISWRAVRALIQTRHPGVPEITTDALAEAIEGGAAPMLLDVRGADEFAVSRLAGARRVDPSARGVPAWLLGEEKDTPIVAYCSVGYRSAALVSLLRASGFSRALNLSGSIFKWANEGREIEAEGRARPGVHPFDRAWGRLLHRELWEWKPDGADPVTGE